MSVGSLGLGIAAQRAASLTPAAGAFPFFGVGAGIGVFAGATLGVLGARATNKRIFALARLNMRRVNQKITQMRVNRFIEMDTRAREGRVALGDAAAGTTHNLAVIEMLASRLVANIARDQDTIDLNLERGELAAEAEKKNIALEASSQTQNKLLAGLTGGLSGALTGAQLGSAISGAVQEGQLIDLAKSQGITALDLARNRTNLARAQTATAGAFRTLAQGTTDRWTSRIRRSSIRDTFTSFHMPLAPAGRRFIPGPMP